MPPSWKTTCNGYLARPFFEKGKSEDKSETVATFVSYYKPLFPLSSLLVGQPQNLWKSAQKQQVG